MHAILFPQISPIAFTFFHFDVYWYSFAYIFGVIFGYLLLKQLSRRNGYIFSEKALEDCIFYSVLGLIIGARLGAVLIFDLDKFIEDPIRLFLIRKGGMSFHGGLLGMVCAIYLLCKKYRIEFLAAADLIVCVAPIGLFLGRIANFVNAELYGKVTDVPWAFIFPYTDGLPRHPSQLYEAGLEGIVLFFIMLLAFHKTDWIQQRGKLSGLFLFLYGCFRSFAEIFREPDAPGYILQYFSMGQLLCVPMVLVGAILMTRSRRSVRY